MGSQTVSTLVIDVVTEADKATAGLDSVADSSAKMSREVDKASKSAERSSRGFAVTADSTDELASKSSQATGALGALSAGFELVGLEKYAMGLQGASMATDFFSGVGDSLNLVLQSTKVQTALARVNTIRHAVATRAITVATRAQAIATRILNAALRANPIGLIITAVLLLVAGFVLLYKRSATFRNIVQAVGRAGRAAIGWVVDKVGDLVGWLKTNVPAALGRLRGVFTAVVSVYTLPFRTVLAVVKDVVLWLREKIGGAVSTAKGKFTAIGDALAKPFKTVLQTVKDIIEWVKKIKVPDINPFNGRTSARTVVDPYGAGATITAGSTVARPAGSVTFQTVVQGAIDPLGTAATIDRVQRKQARRLGLVVL